MIGLDTNVLVRYITQDDPEQSARANKLIEQSCSKRCPGKIAQIVLCELVWVLQRAYRYDKRQVIAVLEQILVTAELDVENEQLAHLALSAWRNGPADFSDYLISLSNQAEGCSTTYSFDTALSRHPTATSPA